MYRCKARTYRYIEHFNQSCIDARLVWIDAWGILTGHVSIHDSYGSIHTEVKVFCGLQQVYVSMQGLYGSIHTEAKTFCDIKQVYVSIHKNMY
jgi:hypothetical protein